jgi:hypothetical protein
VLAECPICAEGNRPGVALGCGDAAHELCMACTLKHARLELGAVNGTMVRCPLCVPLGRSAPVAEKAVKEVQAWAILNSGAEDNGEERPLSFRDLGVFAGMAAYAGGGGGGGGGGKQLSIAEQRARAEQIAKDEALARASSRPCPNPACGWACELVMGCMHTRCAKCHTRFNWCCGTVNPMHGTADCGRRRAPVAIGGDSSGGGGGSSPAEQRAREMQIAQDEALARLLSRGLPGGGFPGGGFSRGGAPGGPGRARDRASPLYDSDSDD